MPLAVDLVREGSRRLWSPRTPSGVALATIKTLGARLGAGDPSAASPLEKAWVEFSRMAGASGEDARWRAAAGIGARPYAVIGDSHSRLLVRRARDADGRWLLPLWWLETGASARGLGRADARSGAGERVRGALLQALALADAPILLKFGQVDVEFVQVFQRLERGERIFDATAFAAFAEQTVDRYLAFLGAAVVREDRGRVHVRSLFPPVLSDAAWQAGYLNAHIIDIHGPAESGDLAQRLAEIEIPDLAARTILHRQVDGLLAEAATAAGFRVDDDFSPFLGPAGTVDPGWLGAAAGTDHHLDFHAIRAPMVDRLWRLFE